MRVDMDPWTDNRVRKALKLCQDRQKILDLAYFGEGLIGQDHHVSQAHPEYAEVPTPPYDPEQAKALLAEAGYPDGLDVEIGRRYGLGRHRRLRRDAQAGCRAWRFPHHPEHHAQQPVLGSVDRGRLGHHPWTHRPLGTMVLELAYTCDAEGEPVPGTRPAGATRSSPSCWRRPTPPPTSRRGAGIMEKLELIQQERGSIGNAYYFTAWYIYWQQIPERPGTSHRLSPPLGHVWIDEEA